MELENTSARAASKEHVVHQEHDSKGRHVTHGATADIEPTLGWRTWVVYAGQSLARRFGISSLSSACCLMCFGIN